MKYLRQFKKFFFKYHFKKFSYYYFKYTDSVNFDLILISNININQ